MLATILVFSWLSRAWRLQIPKGYYFDEVYHAFTALYYAVNDPKGYEWWHTSPEPGTAFEWLHPPIAKLLMGFSIFMFGDNSYAWRLPGAIFGVLTIAAVYVLAETLFKDKKVALLAAFLASLDGLLLTMSRIAMNDIYVTFFMLMTLVFYWKFYAANSKKKKAIELKYLAASGLMAGLAVATKWSGVFVIGIIGLWEVGSRLSGLNRKQLVKELLMIGTMAGSGLIGWPVFRRLTEIRGVMKEVVVVWWGGLVAGLGYRAGKLIGIRRLVWLFLMMMVIPAVVYVGSFGQFWLQGHSVDQFRELHNQIWWYQTHLEATHPYQSKPWQWVLNLKPVWFYVNYGEGARGNTYALANPMIAWGGLVAMVAVVLKGAVKKRKEWLFLGLSYLVVWAPWSVSPRIMFYYHYTPAIPFLAIAVALVLAKLAERKGYYKWLAGGVVAVTALLFVYFYPHWTGIILPDKWVDQYFWFESWR